jgi:prepilin-type N-terminal cleavage/methylation domain-containing protein
MRNLMRMPSYPVLRLPRRGVTLIELIVALAILTALILSSFHAIGTARRVRARNQTMTQLTLRANSDVARLRAEPWENLREGTTPLSDPARPGVTGEAAVRGVPGLALKEITVRWKEDTPGGPCEVVLCTWRDQAKD